MSTIFFNSKLHSYINEHKQKYVSVTTNISEYYKKFDTKGVAKAVARKGEGQYKGMTSNQIIKEWKNISDVAKKQGNDEHEILEIAVKSGIGFKSNNSEYRQLITIDDITNPENEHLRNIDVNLDIVYSNIHVRHKQIYTVLNYFISNGFIPYPEICVYDDKSMICGLVDLPLINFERKEFVIADYKTNKADIRYEAGYFRKDETGNLTNRFVETGERFFKPIEHLFASTGNKYALQLSMYAKLIEQRGFKHKGNILFHIKRDDESSKDFITDDNSCVKVLPVPYLSSEIDLLLTKRHSEINSLFNQ